MEKHNFNIRKAGTNDLDKLANLFDAYRVFYNQPSDPKAAHDFLSARLTNDEIICFLAEDTTGTPAGLVNIYRTFSSVSMAPVWTLNDLYIHQDFRRQGLAQSMMDFAVAAAKENGVKFLQLETMHDNKSAQACYEDNGWERQSAYIYERAIK